VTIKVEHAIDEITRSAISGWAWLPDRWSATLAVELVSVEGNVVGTAPRGIFPPSCAQQGTAPAGVHSPC
jgi:hypothetical protein